MLPASALRPNALLIVATPCMLRAHAQEEAANAGPEAVNGSVDAADGSVESG